MASKEDILDGIRALLAGRQKDDVQARELASQVADRSAALVRRIEHAVGYARRGLKLEACGAAEEEPSIFDEAAFFESGELKAWKAVCGKHRLPEPNAIPWALVQELDETVAGTKDMRRVLSRMRRLVLEDAPSWDRLEALRELIRRDPGNRAWHLDRSELEPVAVAELSDRFGRELADGQLDKAECRLKFLEDGGWVGSGAARTAAELRTRFDAALAGVIVNEMREAVARLEAERVAESVSGVRSGLDALQSLEGRLASHHGETPADLRERASHVEQWLLERESMAAAILENRDRLGELERTLSNDDATLGQLHAALRSAEQTVEGVPESLAGAVSRRIASLEQRQRIRRAGLVAAVAILVIVAVVGTVLSLRRNQSDLRAEGIAESIRRSVADDRLDEADAKLAEIAPDPALSADSRIVEARRALEAARAEIKSRKDRFDALMVEAGDAASEVARPDKADEALKFAGSEADAAQVRDWKRAHARAIEELREQRERDGLARVSKVQTDIAAASPSTSLSWGGQLGKWQGELDNLKREFEDLPRVVDAANSARRLVDELREKVDKEQRVSSRRERLESLGGAASSVDSLVAAIDSHLADFPDSPEASEMKIARSLAPSWRALDAWSRIEHRPSGNLAEAKQRDRMLVSNAVTMFRDSNDPQLPLELHEFCDAAAGLLANVPEWIEAMKTRLAEPAFGYWCIERRNGSRMYLTTNPETEPWKLVPGLPQQKSVRVIKASIPKLEQWFEVFDKPNVKLEGPSPQMTLAKALQRVIDGPQASPNDFDGVLDALDLIVAADGLDGKFAASLAKALVSKFYVALPPDLAKLVSPARELLVQLDPDVVDPKWDWARPDDQNARERSKAAFDAVRTTVKPEEWRVAYRKRLDAVGKAFEVRYVPVGVVRRVDGKPVFLPNPGRSIAGGSELLAVAPGVAGERPSLRTVGTFDGRVVSLDGAPESLPTGSMIFVAERR